jgi:hypothetical protein
VTVNPAERLAVLDDERARVAEELAAARSQVAGLEGGRLRLLRSGKRPTGENAADVAARRAEIQTLSALLDAIDAERAEWSRVGAEADRRATRIAMADRELAMARAKLLAVEHVEKAAAALRPYRHSGRLTDRFRGLLGDSWPRVRAELETQIMRLARERAAAANFDPEAALHPAPVPADDELVAVRVLTRIARAAPGVSIEAGTVLELPWHEACWLFRDTGGRVELVEPHPAWPASVPAA